MFAPRRPVAAAPQVAHRVSLHAATIAHLRPVLQSARPNPRAEIRPMPLLLHTADWQIGRLYNRLPPAEAALLAEARLGTVERIATLATEQAADAVLVAGDVFDAQTVSPRTIRRLFLALQGYRGPWILIPGNHDAALAEGVWATARRLSVIPANVHVVTGPEAEVVSLPDARVAVLCAPLSQRHTAGDLTAAFDHLPSPEGWHRVGVAHGGVQGLLPDALDLSNPIAPDRAARARLDYLALGDWHGTLRIDDRTWYSGTPEPDRFRNNEAGQVLRVRWREPGDPPEVTPLRVAQHRWRSEPFELRVSSDIDRLDAWLRDCEPSDVIELILQGTVDLTSRERLDHVLDEADARVHLLLRRSEALHLRPTDEDIAALQADGYLGEVVTELREAIRQRPPASQSAEGSVVEEADVAESALAILAGILAQRRALGDAR